MPQFLGSVSYLRASFIIVDISGEEAVLKRGDTQFAIGMWLFVSGFMLITYDIRAVVIRVARIRGLPIPPYDSTCIVLIIYDVCLIIFGIASTLFILPDDTSQTVGTGLFIVSNVSFTAINVVALWFLWKEHSRSLAGGEGGEELGALEEGEGAEGSGRAGGEDDARSQSPHTPRGYGTPGGSGRAGGGDMRGVLVVAGLLGNSGSAGRSSSFDGRGASFDEQRTRRLSSSVHLHGTAAPRVSNPLVRSLSTGSVAMAATIHPAEARTPTTRARADSP